ncbi:unnamed protein product [Tilletia controversa]|nr:unnamed protein product [Tilletia controversa]
MLDQILSQVNPYARLLHHARPILEQLTSSTDDVAIILLQPGRDTGADPRTYNRPSVSEIAALIVTPSGSDFDVAPRDIVVRYRSGDIRRVSHLHAAFLPLRFPVLIPYGHFGWRDAILLGQFPRELFSADPAVAAAALEDPNVVRGRGRGGSVHVTLDQFHAYHLHQRQHFSTLFFSNTLLQEWLVDAWVVVEQNRISFLNFNQDLLRREVYSGLQDALISGADLHGIGTRTILPSSFTSGPRFWQARYHDAMSLVRVYGKPDLLAESNDHSKLLAFFDLCKRLPEETASLTYANVPDRFVWNAKFHMWAPRQRGMGQVGRIYYVPHTAQEKYYLRRLLHEFNCPKSFDDLYKFEERTYTTFREACSARGLLSDDAEWHRCLNEAALFQTGAALRHLFCLIIFHNDVEDIPSLYDGHKFDLADDFAFQLRRRGIQDPVQERALSFSRHLLNVELSQVANERTLADFGTPPPDDAFAADTSAIPSPVAREQQWNAEEQSALSVQRYEQMNEDQRSVFSVVTAAVNLNEPALFFLQGSGGYGKTFVMNAIMAHVRGRNQIAIAVASSGIVSLMLEGGRTAHFRFKLPL